MENKMFLGQANELGPNHGKAIRTETERRNLGVYLPSDVQTDGRDIALLAFVLCILVWTVVLP
jgi:hypothetical protein